MPTSFDQRVLVGGKVLVDLERVAERNQRDQIGRLHFLLEEIARRIHAAVQVFGLHRGEVEEHHDEAMVAQVFGTRDDHGLAARCRWCPRPGR